MVKYDLVWSVKDSSKHYTLSSKKRKLNFSPNLKVSTPLHRWLAASPAFTIRSLDPARWTFLCGKTQLVIPTNTEPATLISCAGSSPYLSCTVETGSCCFPLTQTVLCEKVGSNAFWLIYHQSRLRQKHAAWNKKTQKHNIRPVKWTGYWPRAEK